MYEKLYEPLPDTAAYLERLGLKPPRELNREYLDGLVYAHQCRIPFENLDVYAFHRPISLGIADLFQKIVMNKRGGYCFEMNALFTALLNALGYRAWACMCRILRSKDYIPPVMHRGVLVELDGQLYFCDVGYGGPEAPGSLPVCDGARRCFGKEEYFITRADAYWWTLNRMTSQGVSEKVMRFYTMPQENVEFLALSEYCSTSPDSIFTQKVFLNIRTPDGFDSVLGDVFTHARNGSSEVYTIKNRQEFFRIAGQYFGLRFSGAEKS